MRNSTMRFRYCSRISLFFILMLLSMNLLVASEEPQPKINVHLNKQILIGGSLLKYVVYLTYEPALFSEPNEVKTIYFELTNSKQEPVVAWKSQTSTNFLSGEFHIPDYLPGGLYQLHIFTNDTRIYSGTNSFIAPLIIQEIHEEPLQQLTVQKTAMIPASGILNKGDGKNPDVLLLSVEPKVSITFEKKGATLLLSAPSGLDTVQVSVSVTEVSPFDSMLYEKYSPKHQNISTPDFFNFMPEYGFTTLSGKITDSLQRPLTNQVIYLSTESSAVFFKYNLTDENGNFCFALEPEWNNKVILLQLATNLPKNEKTKWQLDPKNGLLPILDTTLYFLNDQELKYLSQLQKRELVHRIFAPDSMSDDSKNSRDVFENLFYRPRYVIYPSDYETLNDFKELTDNILPAVRFKREGDTFKMGIVFGNQVLFDQVLVCLNGNPIPDMNDIAHLSSKEIERVEIFNSPFMYGELTFNGVVSIYTKGSTQNTQQFHATGTVYQNRFYSQRINTYNSNLRTPTVLPDIYWNPSATIIQENPISIDLKNIDIGNSYRITVRGITSSGRFISIDKLLTF